MNCKNFRFLLIPFLLLVVACDRIVEDPRGDEMARLQAWLQVHNITTVPTATGLYYLNTLEGTGNSPVDDNWMVYSFVSRNLDDVVYETTNKDTALLYDMFSAKKHYVPTFRQYLSKTSQFKGLAEGLGMMKEGGKARLIIPSSLGANGSYTTMIYDIDFKKVVEDPEKYERDSIVSYLSHHLGYTNVVDSIYFKDSIPGTGSLLVANDTVVTVKYVGKYLDGVVFDTNIKTIGAANGITVSDKDTLLKFKVGSTEVINGYSIALKQMKKGGVAKVIIPSISAYGVTGKSPILPYEPLLFEITLVEINP